MTEKGIKAKKEEDKIEISGAQTVASLMGFGENGAVQFKNKTTQNQTGFFRGSQAVEKIQNALIDLKKVLKTYVCTFSTGYVS